ncbi:MAG: ATP-binding protein [Bacteroidales bacterium]|nr:ATP-binding protein [Bacteroidales bacterium]
MTRFKRYSFQNACEWIRRYLNIRTSIYGQVVMIIAILSVILFVSFGLIFRSVYENYMNTVLRESGSNIGSLVEGALYYSMFENDKRSLQNTLDIINTLPGIEDVNMYDSDDNLVYSSFPSETSSSRHIEPDCKACHDDLATMFPRNEKAYRIISIESQCMMSQDPYHQRYLMIRSPILNERSCYTADCHAHGENDEVLGSLIIQMPLKDLDDAIASSTMDFYLFAIITTVLLLTFIIIFTRKEIKNPLKALIQVSRSVAKGDLSKRIDVKPCHVEDMKIVSHSVNDMLDKLQAANEELKNWSQQLEYKVQKKSEELGAIQNEIIRIERLASLGKLSSSVAHEINNPLSGILIYSKLIHKQLSFSKAEIPNRDSLLKHIKMIENETKRCGDIVKSLLDFARKDQEDFKPGNAHAILEETYELMAHPIKIANIEFRKEFNAGSDLIHCSPNQIKQACVALLVNASEAIVSNGEIIFRTSNPSKDELRIEVIDNGSGISDDDLPHIFEPFYSVKQDVSGIGLGLSIVHGIITSHRGKIDVISSPGKGTTMIITLPLITT